MRAQDQEAAGPGRSQSRQVPTRAADRAQTPAQPAIPLTSQSTLHLQRTIGNAAVARLVESQQQQPHSHGDDQPVQRSAVPDVLRSPGRPLDDNTRTEMEARLDADFSDVRLHVDTAAQRSAAEIGARAYTSGNHVVIGEGGADTHTLAHELTHVIQQRQGPVAGTDRGDGLRVSDPGDKFEREAEAVASGTMRPPVNRSAATSEGAVQRTVDGSEGRLTDTAEVLEKLGIASGDEWEVAAAQSLIDDHVAHSMVQGTPEAVNRVRKSLGERVKLAKAIISVANNGILTKKDRERNGIQAQQSIDPVNATVASKISLSQSETGPENSAERVAGLLEHQAMSVRMEKYVEENGKQVLEAWMDPKSFKKGEYVNAIKNGLGMSEREWNEVADQPRMQNAVYLEVMKLRGKGPHAAKALAERASNSAIFGGSTSRAEDPEVQQAFKEMGLDRPKEGSHEVRASRSMPASALEFILLPGCLLPFDKLLRRDIENDLPLHYVDGTHTVGVSWAPKVGMPQVRFDIESPNWKQKLQEILEEEERIFAHVTRPLQ
ncbi:DUF4157 domain-containing protein [Actinosynnema sp. NPDC002837]